VDFLQVTNFDNMKTNKLYTIVPILFLLNIYNVFAQNKIYKNKINISFGGYYMFKDNLTNYGQDIANFAIPNLQYLRYFDSNNKFNILLFYSRSQFNRNTPIIKYPHVIGITTAYYGLGMGYEKSYKKMCFNVSSGLLIRSGTEISYVDDHPLYIPEIYFNRTNLIGYGIFTQTSIEYKLTKSFSAMSILRYNLLSRQRNHSISFDLGVSKKF